MAIGIVPGLAEQHVAHPGAAGAAHVRVVAVAAVAPKIVHRALARVAHGKSPLPNVLERRIAHVAGSPRDRAERRTALDGAVRFDAEGGGSCAARAVVTARGPTLEQGLVGPEVAEVVAAEHE